MRMRKVAVLGVSLVVGLVAMASGAGSAAPATVLKASTMVGVSGPYVGATNPIRGVNGGGVAWAIDEGKVVLGADGSLEVKVEGLVLVDDRREPRHQLPRDRELSDDRGRSGGRLERLDRCVPGDDDRRFEDRGDGGAAQPVLRADRVRDLAGRLLVRGDRRLAGVAPGHRGRSGARAVGSQSRSASANFTRSAAPPATSSARRSG